MAAGSIGVAPLVLTLDLDGEAFAELQALRRRYYAPERNVVPAHVTLFKALPGERFRDVRRLLQQAAEREPPIEISVEEVRPLEQGVAVFLRSPRLAALRDQLAREWEPWLAEPDRLRFQPHATIATTGSEAEARRLVRQVSAELRLRRIVGAGLHLWRYRDGPWEDVRVFRFRG